MNIPEGVKVKHVHYNEEQSKTKCDNNRGHGFGLRSLEHGCPNAARSVRRGSIPMSPEARSSLMHVKREILFGENEAIPIMANRPMPCRVGVLLSCDVTCIYAVRKFLKAGYRRLVRSIPMYCDTTRSCVPEEN